MLYPLASTFPKEVSSDEGTDFSGLGDPETLFRFLEASSYCFGYSDSDGDDYDPSREFFHLETDEATLADQGGAGPAKRRDVTPPPNNCRGP